MQSDLHLLLLSLHLVSYTGLVDLGRTNHVELPHLLVLANLRGQLAHVGQIHCGNVATTHVVGKTASRRLINL